MPGRHGGRVSLRGSYRLSRLALATTLRIPQLLRVHAIVVIDEAGRCLGEAQLTIRGQRIDSLPARHGDRHLGVLAHLVGVAGLPLAISAVAKHGDETVDGRRLMLRDVPIGFRIFRVALGLRQFGIGRRCKDLAVRPRFLGRLPLARLHLLRGRGPFEPGPVLTIGANSGFSCPK